MALPAEIAGLIVDLDGVLWLDTQAIGDLPAIFADFYRRGYKVVFATNNATRTPDQHRQKLASFGVETEPWQLVNSSEAVAHHLSRHYPQGGNIFVLGEKPLIDTLEAAGFHASDTPPFLAVIGSIDRALTFEKLKTATLLVRSGLPFLATNPDRTFPTPEGLVPGTGAILAALEAATDVPPLILGKPSTKMYEIALERMQIPAVAALVIGDRLETDIAGAQVMGCQTALVLSGVTTEQKARQWSPAPDWITRDLTELSAVLKRTGK